MHFNNVIFLFMILFGFANPKKIMFSSLNCKGDDVYEFSNFLRILADSHDINTDGFKASCNLNHLNFYNRKVTDFIIAIRFSDTKLHVDTFDAFDEDDDDDGDISLTDPVNDYLDINVGPAIAQLTSNHIKLIANGKEEFRCDVDIFQDESSKDFSTDKFVYAMIRVSDVNTVKVMFSTNNKWQTCGEIKIKKPARKKFIMNAFSKEGINMDIVSIYYNHEKTPWQQNEDTLSTEDSLRNALEHAEERMVKTNNKISEEINFNRKKIWWLRVYVFCVAVVVGVDVLTRTRYPCLRKKVKKISNQFNYGFSSNDHLC